MPNYAIINESFQRVSTSVYSFTNQSIQQVRKNFRTFYTWTRKQWRIRRKNLQKYFRRTTHSCNSNARNSNSSNIERAENYSSRTTPSSNEEDSRITSKEVHDTLLRVCFSLMLYFSLDMHKLRMILTNN